MLNVKAENLQENDTQDTQGALTAYRAENEGSWLLLCPSGLTSFEHSDAKLPNIPAELHTSTPPRACSTPTLGESLIISPSGFTWL